ncbi:DNA-binding transcriptional regulator [Snodgrassella sp. CFCC 13594]|uniref:helix-turn-helix domain-containing protein n=1 Tax=Snodgrassella sp. CFCC 13594 TaxID=1775559 RepID=UPI0009EE078A|nr:helix-turn-helix domain-containing protein [Snodgrassella sp. CFCC 13594]
MNLNHKNAVLADDPDALSIRDSLVRSLEQAKAGKFARTTTTPLLPVAELRLRMGLSQNKFARKLGISVNTLKSWEQGQRKPSGAANVLLQLLDKHPELVEEMH